MTISDSVKKFTSFNFKQFTPKLLICLREGYSKQFFMNDLLAGITVGVIALPLAIAFAIGAGVGPERGLFTAIIAGFLISLLGGSRVQVSGPTGAFVVIIYEIVARHGYEGLAIATLMAAVILILLGISKCGVLIRFIPYPVITGFTTGIATVIFTSQIKDFCGLQIAKPAADFIQRLSQYWNFSHTFSPNAFLIALFATAIIVGCRSINRRIPGAIVAVIITTLVSYFFALPIETIESKFGAIPSSLPTPTFPDISLASIETLFPAAIAIALLGAIESLLAAVVSDGMTGFRHNSNVELISQGIGNIGSIIFGGIPATGAIARTTANVQMHAKTPISGLIHAVTLFLLMALLAPVAGKIPLASLAAVLVFVAYNMSELDHFADILKGPKSDALVLVITFGLTVFVDLIVAVQVGVLLAAFLFLKHMSEKTTVTVCKLLKKEAEEVAPDESKNIAEMSIPQGVEVFEINGPFFFGVCDILNEALRLVATKPKVFILRLAHVPLIDSSGMQAIKQFYHKCQKLNIEFFITEARPDVFHILQKSSVKKTLGEGRFFRTLDAALHQAKVTN
jgi:sulfate permease, SulP family